MKTAGHPLVARYLAAVEREAAGLSPERRSELLCDLAEHIEVALAEETTPGEDGIRAVLARLGDPRAIVATALGEEPPAPPDSRWHVITPLILLPVAGPLSVASPGLGGIALIIGIVLLWNARVWKTRDKVIGIVAALLVPVLIVVAGLIFGLGAFRLNALTIVTVVPAAMLIPGVACAYLAWAARRTA